MLPHPKHHKPKRRETHGIEKANEIVAQANVFSRFASFQRKFYAGCCPKTYRLKENYNHKNGPQLDKRIIGISRGYPNTRTLRYVHENFTTYDQRKNTFSDWPLKDIISPQKLAEAGFFYSGLFDIVHCYHCDGALQNWQIGDDPWAVHANAFQNCAFIYIKRGKRFLANCKLDYINKPIFEPQPETSIASVSRFTCKVCLTNEIGCVLYPCSHSVTCNDCTLKIKSCPLCRTEIKRLLRLYLVS
uniref:RING-type domain-containing protein n=1 Tax=Tetranychus urticae TaxID=32264 RepID=T1L4N9_TETUR